MSFDLELKGKRALVTGGTKGLGAAVVKSLHDAGVEVMTTARSAPETPVQGVNYVTTDLSTAEGVGKLAGAVEERWGSVDILINSLGGSAAPVGGFAVLDDAVWFDELNLTSCLQCGWIVHWCRACWQKVQASYCTWSPSSTSFRFGHRRPLTLRPRVHSRPTANPCRRK